jgi:two-component system CheB/CheR fusion protein
MGTGEAGQQANASERKPRALVIDDEADIRLMLDLFLRGEGFEVSAAPSAVTALEIAQRATEAFDLIISDIGLPRMDGYQLAEALRQLPGYAAVPMIAVTGFVEYADRTRALQSGFDERLTKPINLGLLIKLIREFSARPQHPAQS